MQNLLQEQPFFVLMKVLFKLFTPILEKEKKEVGKQGKKGGKEERMEGTLL